MIIFLNPDGTAPVIVPERIFQGSNAVNQIVALTPLTTKVIKVGFILPNDDPVDGGFMVDAGTQDYPVNGKILTLNVFTLDILTNVTKYTGDVDMSFSVTLSNGTLNSYAARFTVEKSAAPVMPAPPDVPTYELILQWLNELELNKQDKKIFLLPSSGIPTQEEFNEMKKLAKDGNSFLLSADGVVSTPTSVGTDVINHLNGQIFVTLRSNGASVSRDVKSLSIRRLYGLQTITDLTRNQYYEITGAMHAGEIVMLAIYGANPFRTYLSTGVNGNYGRFVCGNDVLDITWNETTDAVDAKMTVLATLDENGNVIENALTATWAETAEKADTATKAEQDGQGRVIADTYAIAQNVETVSEQDTYSCDYINELHREALDLDPYFIGTAGSVVTVEDTPTGKYLEPDDYKIALPLRQRENMLPYVGDINRTQNKLHVESRGNGSYLMKISEGENVDNSLIRVAISPQVIQKGTYYIHLRNNAATIGASFNIVGIGEPAFMAENRIFTVTVAADTTVNEIIFYTLPTTAPMEFLFRPSLERVGDVTAYVGFTGALSPTNPIPVESPSAVTVKSVGQNLISFPDKQIVINNWYYTDEHPNPHFLMTVGKTYTLAFEYEIENATAYVVCDTGRGTETIYKQNMINGVTVASVFPAKGRTVLKFTVQKSNDGDYFWFRPLRFATPNTITNAHVSNVMLVEGAYSAETMPESTPYESETVEIAPRDVNGNAVALSGGVAGAENTIEYRDGKPYYVARTGKAVLTGAVGEDWSRARTALGNYQMSTGALANVILRAKSDTERVDTMTEIGLARSASDTYWEKPGVSVNKNGTLLIYDAQYKTTVDLWTQYIAAHPMTVWYPLATPIYTELAPASLPILQTYSPETTLYVSSDVEGLYPSIDLTALSAQNATFAKGMLKLNNGEVLTPLTTADMVLTADGRALDAMIAQDYATKAEIGTHMGTTVTVGSIAQVSWDADTKLNALGTAARATADADGNTIASTYATKTALNASNVRIAALETGAYKWTSSFNAGSIAVGLETNQNGVFYGIVSPSNFQNSIICVNGTLGGAPAFGVFNGDIVSGVKFMDTGAAVRFEVGVQSITGLNPKGAL